MKVILLAGGFGTRLADYSSVIPKPMVKIGDKPILWRIMNHYSKYGHNDFYLALGYKSEVIKEYFLNYYTLNNDFSVDLATGKLDINQINKLNWRVTLSETGLNTMTGGRLKKMKKYTKNDTFLMTYGDGLSDVNIQELIEFHKSHGKMGTVTAVHPGARFGELLLNDYKVKKFEEKPQTQKGWINGGIFVIEPDFLDLIDDDDTILERDPLEKASVLGELMAYKHEGFWRCMDTKRDRDSLQKMWEQGKLPCL